MKFSVILISLLTLGLHGLAQNPGVIKIETLEKRIQNSSDTTYIINFWATWCAPCVKELPAFDSIGKSYLNKKVKVLLVSLDFKEDLDTKLIPFIVKKNIQSEVVLLDETNANYFIPKISNDWSGSIPATLIVNQEKNKSVFFEKKVDFNFLKAAIENILN